MPISNAPTSGTIEAPATISAILTRDLELVEQVRLRLRDVLVLLKGGASPSNDSPLKVDCMHTAAVALCTSLEDLDKLSMEIMRAL